MKKFASAGLFLRDFSRMRRLQEEHNIKLSEWIDGYREASRISTRRSCTSEMSSNLSVSLNFVFL